MIQFGLIRSGSTLIYNIMKEYVDVKKVHSLDNFKGKVVITYRNPLDIIASSLMRYELDPTYKNIDKQLQEFNKHGGKYFDKAKGLFLKYEDFYNDFNFIFDELESYLNIKIDREEMSKKYKISNIKKITDKYKDFSVVDTNHWHGKHISKFMGEPNTHKEMFNKEQINYIIGKIKSNKLKEIYNLI